MTYRHAVRLILALTGVYLLIGPGGKVDLVGVLWIFVSLWGFALQLVLMQWHLLGYDARAVTFYVLIGMTAGVVAWWLVQGMPWDAPGVSGWTTILVLAVVSTYAARLLQFNCRGAHRRRANVHALARRDAVWPSSSPCSSWANGCRSSGGGRRAHPTEWS